MSLPAPSNLREAGVDESLVLAALAEMERGQIAEQGSHAQLMELGGLYARLHNQVRSSTPGEPQI